MTPRSSASTQLLGAIAAAMLLAGGAASAQTIAKPDPRGATPAPAKPAQLAKPAKPAATAAKATPAEQGTDYWAINTDIGKYRDTKPVPEPTAPGRVPLQGAQGTVGFASGSVRTGQLADGRAAPGLERYNQDPQSYAGMSLSLTNSNKTFPLPTQMLPHNQW